MNRRSRNSSDMKPKNMDSQSTQRKRIRGRQNKEPALNLTLQSSAMESKKMRLEKRKWKDMNEDCLVNIFGRLGLQSRLLDIPFVCKSWHRTIQDPLCWQQLVFPNSIRGSSEFSGSHGLINWVVNRSQRCATLLVLPRDCSKEELIYVSEKCSALKRLTLPDSVCDNHKDIIPSLIVKWKDLEFLSLGSCSCVVEILELMCFHLPNFSGLCVTSRYIDHKIASAIVSLSPKLKNLILEETYIDRVDLMMILRGCKQLVELDVRNCTGFDADDDEILELASGIKNFRCEGSMVKPYVWDDYDGISDGSDEDFTSIYIDYYTL